MKNRFNTMQKLFLLIVCQILFIHVQGSQLDVYPGLPNNHLKSSKYIVKVKLNSSKKFQNSYVYEYVNNGVNPDSATNRIDYDPWNIRNDGKRNALTDASHWTTFSFDGNIQIEVSKVSGSITSCDIRPYRYGLSANIRNGRAYITLNESKKKMMLTLDNNEKHPLFIFTDELEKNVPDSNNANVLYFGPGIHTLERNNTQYTAYYTMPSNIHTVYIAGGAYVKGAIYAYNRSDITVRGRGILSGEGISYSPHRRPDAHVFFEGEGSNQVIEGITIIKPIHFHVLTRGSFDVENIKCFSYNNTTDGWGGGTDAEKPSTCKHSFFKVNDDVFKLYGDNFLIEDNVVYHQTNSPVFEFGWGNQAARNCTVNRVDIIWDNSAHPGYPEDEGAGIIGWAKVRQPDKAHTGHVFNDIRSDGPCKRLIHLNVANANNTQLDIKLSNFAIHSTLAKSDIILDTTGLVKIECKQVTIGGKCLDKEEFMVTGEGKFEVKISECESID